MQFIFIIIKKMSSCGKLWLKQDVAQATWIMYLTSFYFYLSTPMRGSEFGPEEKDSGTQCIFLCAEQSSWV